MNILLNQNLTPQKIGIINPNTTVLQWLRQNSLVGTKEGCAAGDCGSCTAVVGEVINSKIEYKSINTCIALISSMVGKHLVTVEGLKQNNKLHPVQQAMLDEHGSQCGFCTPGFIMSLFALYHNHNDINLTKINTALSGNLCRCTGYKPIIEAAFVAFAQKTKISDDFYSVNQEKITQILNTINSEEVSFEYKNEDKTLKFDRPKSIKKLSEILLTNPDAKIIAGGSDLGLDITQQLQEFNHIVNIKSVKELNFIKDNKDALEIGASVSYQDSDESLVKYFPALNHFLHRFASMPIRNFATIGGNIANASPIGDMPPVLLALETKLKLHKGSAERIIELEEFFVDYKKTTLQKSEFIKSIIIPKLASDEKLFTHKISKRFEDDISAVCLAIKIKIKDTKAIAIKIAFGGMAAIPKRAKNLEQILLDNWEDDNLTDLLLDALRKEFTPFNDVRASAEYRLQVSAKLLIKTILKIKGEPMLNLADINDNYAILEDFS